MIHGFFDARGRPIIEGYLSIPGLALRDAGLVRFVFDTGADLTAIHLPDALRLGIPFEGLKETQSLSGIGGSVPYASVQTQLFFINREPNGGITAVPSDISLLIEIPTATTQPLPALLGRDVIGRMSVLIDQMSNQLNCVMHSFPSV